MSGSIGDFGPRESGGRGGGGADGGAAVSERASYTLSSGSTCALEA